MTMIVVHIPGYLPYCWAMPFSVLMNVDVSIVCQWEIVSDTRREEERGFCPESSKKNCQSFQIHTTDSRLFLTRKLCHCLLVRSQWISASMVD